MFFSARELHEHLLSHSSPEYALWRAEGTPYLDRPVEEAYRNKVTLSRSKDIIKRMRKAVVLRAGYGLVSSRQDMHFAGKWLRPWNVVPKLRNFRPPAGDYGIGIEVEMGFNTIEDSRFIADQIKDWKYIAVDREGGRNPIEATFPPVLLSKFGNSQAIRYLRLLNRHKEKVFNHNGDRTSVGTHVNVSSGNSTRFQQRRVSAMHNTLDRICYGGNDRHEQEFCKKYFGRSEPYGTIYSRGSYLEYKLFNSTTSTKQLKKYVEVAVTLTKMIEGREVINMNTVKETLRSKVKV